MLNEYLTVAYTKMHDQVVKLTTVFTFNVSFLVPDTNKNLKLKKLNFRKQKDTDCKTAKT